MIDPLRIAVALAPIALYLMVLGLLRLRKHPTVMSGALDFLLFGMAVVGLIAIGPMELFFPRAAYAVLGSWVWALLMGLYLFGLMLIALNLSPKILVYGLDANELRSQLREILDQNQVESKWMDHVVQLPQLGVQGTIEKAGRFRIAHIASVGNAQNIAGWYALERLLVANTKPSSQSNARYGLTYLLVGILLVSAAGGFVYNDRIKLQQLLSQNAD